MPSQGTEEPGHQTEDTPGFAVAQLLEEGKKTWRLCVGSLSCLNRLLCRRSDAPEQFGVDGAKNLAEDDQVSETANGVRLFYRVDRELHDFVALGEYAVEHLKHMGIAQMLE